MKFVHIADLHLDSPFTSLSAKGNLGETRRLEQRKILKKIINYIKENNVNYLFIAGDLYEHEYVKKSSIEYINNLFKEIPNTKIFITPGNHDPYIINSYYDTYEFAENVYIFRGEIEKVEEFDINVYGMAFTSFYMENDEINKLNLPSSNKPNIFVLHGDLNGSKDENGFSYNPINELKLKSYKFDYIALGHIHTTNFKEGKENNILYAGSPISLGFDELGEHGMIIGEINNGKLKTEFVKLDDREFIEIELNIENFISKEELIMHISELNLNENNLYKIILVGKRNFEINTREIIKLVSNENILKIKDLTKTNYNLEELAKEKNLKGYFVREALKKIDDGIVTREEVEKAIEIGLEAM